MKRLVIVADNSLIAEAIRIGLDGSGEFEILGRVDGRSASARTVIDAEPEAVLLDDMEHAAEALSLIRAIKAENDRIAIVLLTARMDPEWLDQAFDAGADGAICKLIHPVALGTLLRETVNGNVVHAFSRAQPERTVPSDCPLTARELEILRFVSDGSTNCEIARQLWVTEQTVKFHLSNLYRKLGVANRTEASHYAHVNGLLRAEPRRQLAVA